MILNGSEASGPLTNGRAFKCIARRCIKLWRPIGELERGSGSLSAEVNENINGYSQDQGPLKFVTCHVHNRHATEMTKIWLK